ncbi:hypothetical protein C8F01DRAFT_274120 [Mycena amicta]|nr:hypothetical protein C8F01DRAFT_274120 [Mycena amicta]
MANPTLPLRIEEIFAECPRFRVLAVGKSGAGKSSLISYAFGVDTKSVSHHQAGECDINEEIKSPQNDRFVLHDSKGFEPGDTNNLNTAKSFIESRSGPKVPLNERVHAVWYVQCVVVVEHFHHRRLCVQTPFAGGRIFETGDESFLELATSRKIPVVVVFTQYDRLVSKEEENPDLDNISDDDEVARAAARRAEERFENECVGAVRKLKVKATIESARTSGLYEKTVQGKVVQAIGAGDRKSLDDLIMKTRNLLENDMEGDGWIVAAAAQRASATVKIYAGISVGMKRYWRGLASSIQFRGTTTLQECLNTVHTEMTDSWNFHDPKDLLIGEDFMKEIRKLAQFVTVKEEVVQSWFTSDNIATIQTLLGLVASTAVVAIAGPVIAGIGLTGMFVKFIADAYRSTPETLCCFMGYIIDLTLVLNELFLQLLPIRPPRTITPEAIENALEAYANSQLGTIHREIREYVRGADWAVLVKSNAAEKKVQELILEYTGEYRRR